MGSVAPTHETCGLDPAGAHQVAKRVVADCVGTPSSDWLEPADTPSRYEPSQEGACSMTKPKRTPKQLTGPGRRPPSGSRLTDDQKALIVSAIEAGATDHVAAVAAGISAKTFRELRQRAEGRHPKRKPTPELVRFFADVDRAIARARLKRELIVADTDSKHWLQHRARSKPGLEGWTAPMPDEPESVELAHVLSVEELRDIVATLVLSGAVALPGCGDPACTCRHHGPVAEGGTGDVVT
jgi:hypothetical protein